MTYCTVQDVRSAGAPASATDATITAAIASAQERVDAYTGDWFEPRTATVTATMTPDGTARLPRTPQSITEVAILGGQSPVVMEASTYYFEQPTDLGSRDRLYLTGYSLQGYETIAGFESYRSPVDRPRLFERRVRVTGTFGRSVTPDPVRDATAILAAGLTADPTGTASVAGGVNLEGDADLGSPATVPVQTVGLVRSSLPSRGSTGDARADALLEPYRANRARVS